MGDSYDFNFIENNGEWVIAFTYRNSDTGYNDISVQMTEEQIEQYREWQAKQEELEEQRVALIKSWIKDGE